MAEVGYDLKVVACAEVSAMLYGADHVFEAGAGRIPQFAQRLVRGDVQGYLVYEIVRIVAFARDRIPEATVRSANAPTNRRGSRI